MQKQIDHSAQIDEVLNESMKLTSRMHKHAIVTELNKRQERKKEEMRLKKEEEEERQKRREKRAALRERHRIAKLKEQINKEVILSSIMEEYTPKLRIYDIRA